jgi:hypothetical protein
MSEDDAYVDVRKSPEKNSLPSGWKARSDQDNRVYFLREADNFTSYNHPRLGALPKPWILIYDGRREAYKNRSTGKITHEDPRFFKENIDARMEAIPKRLRAGANIIKATEPGMMKYMSRE